VSRRPGGVRVGPVLACLQARRRNLRQERKTLPRLPGDSHPFYDAADSSVGSCLQCPFGHFYNRRSFSCECPKGQISQEFAYRDLTFKFCAEDTGCGDNEVRDSAGACVRCASETYAHQGECVPAIDLHNRIGAKAGIPLPGCPKGQKREGEACVSACATGEQYDARLNLCVQIVRAPQPAPPRRPPPAIAVPSPVAPGPIPRPSDPQAVTPVPVDPGALFQGLFNQGGAIAPAPTPLPPPRAVPPPAMMVPQQSQPQPQFQMQMQPFLGQPRQFQQMAPR